MRMLQEQLAEAVALGSDGALPLGADSLPGAPYTRGGHQRSWEARRWVSWAMRRRR